MVTHKLKKVRSLTVEMPCVIIDGLNDASSKFKTTKADIVRSIIYDFLTSSGILPHNEEWDMLDDRCVKPVGRSSKLLSLE